jgi:hypothetical protein
MLELNYTIPVRHSVKNLGGCQRGIPRSSSFVMLSDKSIAFRGHSQGGSVTINGVETSRNGYRCFDSVLDSSSQTDLVASFYKETLNMTRETKTE